MRRMRQDAKVDDNQGDIVKTLRHVRTLGGQQMTDIHAVIAELKALEAKEEHTLVDQLYICNHMSDLLRYTIWCEEKICELDEELAARGERDE